MKLNSIQALRGIAAFLVLVGHLIAVEAKQAGYTIMPTVLSNGASGVDLFFVISGFIMVWVAGEGPRGPKAAASFLTARILRIYPLWWIFAGLLAIYLWLSYGVPWDAEMLATYGGTGPDHLIRSVFLVPQDSGFPVLGVGWTLVHEMYFYICFALILLLPQRALIPGLLVWACLVIAGKFTGLSSHIATSFVTLALHPLTLEFMLGAGVALLIKRGIRDLALTIGLLGIVAFFVNFFFFGFNETPYMLGWGRDWKFGIPAAAILYSAACLEIDLRLKIPKFAIALGDWSYVLYLSHILVVSTIARVLFPILGPTTLLGHIAYLTIGMIGAITASAVFHYTLERPILKLSGKLRARLFGPSRKAGEDEVIRNQVW